MVSCAGINYWQHKGLRGLLKLVHRWMVLLGFDRFLFWHGEGRCKWFLFEVGNKCKRSGPADGFLQFAVKKEVQEEVNLWGDGREWQLGNIFLCFVFFLLEVFQEQGTLKGGQTGERKPSY